MGSVEENVAETVDPVEGEEAPVESDGQVDGADAETGDEGELEEGPERDPELADGESPDFKWYIVKTLTGHENKVAKSIRENVVNLKKGEYFSKILVPEDTVTSNAGGKKRTIKKKFFPGYVLVKMIMNNETWHLVKNIDRISGFVGGTPNNPSPISEEEASYMTDQAKDGFKKLKSNVPFKEGDQVKVVEGPFASFVGTIEAVSEKGRVKVNVSIFGRPTPVELEFYQVEKAS